MSFFKQFFFKMTEREFCSQAFDHYSRKTLSYECKKITDLSSLLYVMKKIIIFCCVLGFAMQFGGLVTNKGKYKDIFIRNLGDRSPGVTAEE